MNNIKPKILFLLTTDDWGGAQQYVANLVTYLAKNGHQVHVAFGAVDKKQKLIIFLQENQIKYHVVKHLQRNINPINDIRGLWEIAKIIRTEKFDIVHANSSKAGFSGRLAAWLLGVKKIYYTAHGWVFNEKIHYIKRHFYQFIEAVAAHFSTKIFCLSQTEYDLALSKRIASQDKLEIISLGIDIELIINRSQADNQFSTTINKWGEDNLIIGTVGNFYPTKNTELVVEIAHQLINIEKKPVKFIIVGDGQRRKIIEQQIGQYNLAEHILLTGFVSNPSSLMRSFDIFILTSTKEGFPYTILEAGALQIPVISTNVGGIPEIIQHQKTGILIEPPHADQFVYYINQIHEKKINTKTISQNLYQQVINNFDLRQTLKNQAKYYQ